MNSPKTALSARRDRFVERFVEWFVAWFTQIVPVLGFAMAAVGGVLTVTAIAGQGWTTPAVMDPYVAVLMIWNLAGFWVSASSYENATGWRRAVAAAGVAVSSVAVLAATLRVLIAVLIAIAIPVMQKKGERW